MRTALLVSALLLAACGSDSDGSSSASCDTEGVEVTGAYAFHTSSAATVEVAGRIVGVGGFDANASGSYLFGAQFSLSDNLDDVGVHDVVSTPVTLLVAPESADCQTADACDGFLARAGTFEVLTINPYSASFELTDLVRYDGSDDAGGAAIAGTAMGCVQSAD